MDRDEQVRLVDQKTLEVLKFYDDMPGRVVIAIHIAAYIEILRLMGFNTEVTKGYCNRLLQDFRNMTNSHAD